MDRTTLVAGMPIKQTVEGQGVIYHVVTNISKSIISLLDIETQNEVEIAQEIFDISTTLQVATKEEMESHLKTLGDNVKKLILAKEEEVAALRNYETNLLNNKRAVCAYFDKPTR